MARIPPPPPALVAVASYVPTAEEKRAQVLELREGEHYYEKAAPRPRWRFVRRLGPELQQPEGWARADMLARKDFAAPDFSPFLGDWKTCVAKLQSIGGTWEDDRRQASKIYNVAVFPVEGTANVLSELRNGKCREGHRLVRVRRLQGRYVIMWTENFCLSADSDSRRLQWQPVRAEKHAVWTWTRR